MDLSEALRIWRRWWILTFALIILLSVGVSAALPRMRTYQSGSQVVLLASRSAAKLNGGNPYMSFSPSLTLTADALSREIMSPGTMQDLAARGFLGQYTVMLAPYTTNTTGSVLLITVTGSRKTLAESTLHAVTNEISTELLQLQRSVPARSRVRAATLSLSPRATLSVSGTARSVIPLVAVGLLLALGMPLMADGWVCRRRARRRGAVRSEGALRPADRFTDGSASDNDLVAHRNGGR